MTSAPAGRLPALDWMRGLVMVLMTIDHAGHAFDPGLLMTDGSFMYKPGTPLPAAQFFSRWVTHLCAPTFVFLAGAALALSVERRAAAGTPSGRLDRFILARGALIVLFELWMRYPFRMDDGSQLLQVLYAIGVSLMAMAALRRLPTGALVAVGLALVVGGEALVRGAQAPEGGETPFALKLIVTGGRAEPFLVGYPFVHWLAVMMLGWAFGRRLLGGPVSVRSVALVGAASLAVFVVVRATNGYGNMSLPREDGSLIQWLHVSKYPPALTYHTLELGLMLVALAGFFAVPPAGAASAWLDRTLGVFGRTAMFFYLLHAHLLTFVGRALGMDKQGSLGVRYLATVGALLVLHPACRAYGRYKAAHPQGWTRFV